MSRLAPVLLLSACAAPPTFTQVDTEVLVPSCGFSSCHGAGTGGLRIDGDGDYERLVDVVAQGDDTQTLVVPGDSEASYLVLKMVGDASIVGDEMPPNTAISDERIALVRDWIDAGALND